MRWIHLLFIFLLVGNASAAGYDYIVINETNVSDLENITDGRAMQNITDAVNNKEWKPIIENSMDTYATIFGSLLYVILVGLFFAMLYTGQKSALMVSGIILTSGAIVIKELIPSNFITIIITFAVLGTLGIIYKAFKER